LGAIQKRVTKRVLLPKPMLPGQTTLVLPPTTASPNGVTQVLIAPGMIPASPLIQVTPSDSDDATTEFGPDDNSLTINYALNSSGSMGELANMKALYTAGPTGLTTGVTPPPPTADQTFMTPIGMSVVGQSLPLLYTNGVVLPHWQPGAIAVITGGNGLQVTTDTGGGNWMQYRLPGMALYDAWGVEVLYSTSPQGTPRLISAGADGVFAVNPGVDHLIQTNVPITPLLGDDLNGSSDNKDNAVEETK
jgi:hypothetical protein